MRCDSPSSHSTNGSFWDRNLEKEDFAPNRKSKDYFCRSIQFKFLVGPSNFVQSLRQVGDRPKSKAFPSPKCLGNCIIVGSKRVGGRDSPNKQNRKILREQNLVVFRIVRPSVRLIGNRKLSRKTKKLLNLNFFEVVEIHGMK